MHLVLFLMGLASIECALPNDVGNCVSGRFNMNTSRMLQTYTSVPDAAYYDFTIDYNSRMVADLYGNKSVVQMSLNQTGGARISTTR